MTDDTDSDPLSIPAGPRVTANPDVLTIEASLDQPVENPAIPASIFEDCQTPEDYRRVIQSETERDEPRKHVVALANRRIAFLEDRDEDGEVSDG